MNFSTNQVRQFYVANAEGDLVVKDKGGFRYLELKEGGRSDLMEPAKITHIEHTLAEELAVYNKMWEVALLTNPEIGKTYTIKVTLSDLYGAGEEYVVPVVATFTATSTNKKDVYDGLVKSLKYSLKNYPLTVGSDTEGLFIETDLATANEGWTNAINPLKEVPFTVYVDEEIWNYVAKYEESTNEGVKEDPVFVSGYKLAELEYFCMGERGDQYRMVGYPNHIVTKYNIVPTEKYDVIDIMYYYTDNKEGVQRSEKVITVAAPDNVATKLLEDLKGTAEGTKGVNPDEDFLV